MIKTFLISMFAVFLFALGAAGAWFYLQLETDQELADDTSTPTGIVLQNPDPVPPPSMPLGLDGGLPHAVRGPALDAEQLYQLNTLTEAKRAQLSQYEDRLREHKLRIKAGDADVQSAQREVEGALEQVRSLMDATDRLLGEVTTAVESLQKQKVELDAKQAKLEEIQGDAGAIEAKNVKTFAEIIQSMPPNNAADTIKEMWNDGKMDFAIQLLRQIEARNVAKILAEVQDPQLIAELASRYPLAPQLR